MSVHTELAQQSCAENLRKAACLAIEVQSACNLSGCVHTFSREIMPAVWAESNRLGKGTDWVNKHPIVRLFVDKLTHLAGIQSFEHSLTADYEAVNKLARGETV